MHVKHSFEGDIPIIDISPFFFGDRSAKKEVAKKIGGACETTGFLIINGHGIAQAILGRTFRSSRAFFRLNQAAKNRWCPQGPARQRGYHPLGTRGLASTLDNDEPPDLRESLFLGPIDDHRAAFARVPEAATAYAPNIYPPKPPDLANALVAAYRAYEQLAGSLFQIFAVALGLHEDYFSDKFDQHFSILGCHYYPPTLGNEKVGQLRTGAHTDFGAFTILSIADAPGGLEVCLPGNRWSPVKPPPESLVVNLGDMMARWTNDHWMSTLHRVANPPTLRSADSERQAIGFFAHPNFDAEISCIPSCLKPGSTPNYPEITAGEHISRKISKSQASVSSIDS